MCQAVKPDHHRKHKKGVSTIIVTFYPWFVSTMLQCPSPEQSGEEWTASPNHPYIGSPQGVKISSPSVICRGAGIAHPIAAITRKLREAASNMADRRETQDAGCMRGHSQVAPKMSCGQRTRHVRGTECIEGEAMRLIQHLLA